jgi:hypothetical protein
LKAKYGLLNNVLPLSNEVQVLKWILKFTIHSKFGRQVANLAVFPPVEEIM